MQAGHDGLKDLGGEFWVALGDGDGEAGVEVALEGHAAYDFGEDVDEELNGRGVTLR